MAGGIYLTKLYFDQTRTGHSGRVLDFDYRTQIPQFLIVGLHPSKSNLLGKKMLNMGFALSSAVFQKIKIQ